MARKNLYLPGDIRELPHWARVAFAARCARLVRPWLERLWKEAQPKHLRAVKIAIYLAEKSSAAGCPDDRLKKARLNATQVAGAVLYEAFGFRNESDLIAETEEEHRAFLIAFVAKAAENACESARTRGDESIMAAMEACDYAQQVARGVGALKILRGIRRDFARVRYWAKHGDWNDQSPVSSAVFRQALPPEGETRKPWWKFW
jgi:hypothetical protein